MSTSRAPTERRRHPESAAGTRAHEKPSGSPERGTEPRSAAALIALVLFAWGQSLLVFDWMRREIFEPAHASHLILVVPFFGGAAAAGLMAAAARFRGKRTTGGDMAHRFGLASGLLGCFAVILVLFLAPRVQQANDAGRLESTQLSLREVAVGLEKHRRQNDAHPIGGGVDTLSTLVGEYLPADFDLVDAWGHDLRYQSLEGGRHYLLASSGPDGVLDAPLSAYVTGASAPVVLDDLVLFDGQAVGGETRAQEQLAAPRTAVEDSSEGVPPVSDEPVAARGPHVAGAAPPVVMASVSPPLVSLADMEHIVQGEMLEAAARAEAERLANVEAERVAKEEVERLAKVEAERVAKVEAERVAKVEAERLAKVEAERVAKVEAERLARVEAERVAKAEAERLAKLEAERVAMAEAERLAKLEAERVAKAEAERLAKLEAERVAKAEAERLVKEAAARGPQVHADLQIVRPHGYSARPGDPDFVGPLLLSTTPAARKHATAPQSVPPATIVLPPQFAPPAKTGGKSP